MVLDDLNQLNPSNYGLSDSEFESFKAQLRCMRAWGYLRLLNTHRNCILTTTSDQAVNELPENRTDSIGSSRPIPYCIGRYLHKSFPIRSTSRPD